MSEQHNKATVEIRKVKSGLQAIINHPAKKGRTAIVLSEPKLSTELAELLRQSPKTLEGKEVEYVMKKGQLDRVWEAGKAWDRVEQTQIAAHQAANRPGDRRGVNPRSQHPGSRYRMQDSQRPRQQHRPGEAPSRHNGKFFENPYNFVPTPTRDTTHPTLGDSKPVGHHRYYPDHWSGRIVVEMKTKTPLLIPDLGSEDQADHKTFGLRLDENGAPYLPPTSVKGALRAAYEAVTNSRMAVFEDHSERLALRHPAQSGAGVVPLRVSNDGENLELLNGTSALDADGQTQSGQPQCAAWMPCYARARLLKRGNNLVLHGRRVWARIQQWQHYRRYKDRDTRAFRWRDDFRFWRVLEIAADADQAPQDSPEVAPHRTIELPSDFRYPTFSTPIGVATRWVRGWVVRNGLNITRKHDERLFFDSTNGRSPQLLKITQSMRTSWGTLLSSYRQANERELRLKRPCPTALPQNRNYEFSRHILEAYSKSSQNTLAAETLCYAALERAEDGYAVRALYPVMISRDLYAASPAELLDKSLRPAPHRAQLSPADRVFGWVNQNGDGSYKGQLRVGAITCADGAAAVERVGGADGKPLAILGQPKPAQARFYCAQTRQGEPLERGANKSIGYAEGRGLRGRKAYVHHKQAELDRYWESRTSSAQANQESLKLGKRTVYREWQSPNNERSDQNRSITAWVRPATTFRFDIDLTNLSDVELGALLWILRLPEDCYLRVGGGKPLGFGSVKVGIDGLDLRKGDAVAADYQTFGETAQSGDRIRDLDGCDTVVAAFRAALPSASGQPDRAFDELPAIKAFSNAAKGGHLPVHYPRTDLQENPGGESFKWFVENEKSDRNRHERYSLPALDDDKRGLPILEERRGR